MPSCNNYVCFDCRIGVRRAKVAEALPLCPGCGRECCSIGYKIPLPPKKDAKAWHELYVLLRERARTTMIACSEANVKRVHELERQVDRILQRPDDRDRARSVRELQKQIEGMKRQGF